MEKQALNEINNQLSLKTIRGPLIETNELFELIKQQFPLKILQAGYPLTKQDGELDTIYQKERIPGAQLFDLKEVFDKTSKYLNQLSSLEQFANYMKSQNLKKDDIFVIYDDFGAIGACRTWSNILIFGISKVYVLNGSSIKWKNEKLPIESTQPRIIIPANEEEKFDFNSNLICDYNQTKTISEKIQNKENKYEIIDTRNPNRFNGTDPETRPGVRSGNIPGSKNIFFREILNSDWSFKSNEELIELFKNKEINLASKIINSCNSGMTATVAYLAEELLGIKDKTLYDGSWTEYVKFSCLSIQLGFY